MFVLIALGASFVAGKWDRDAWRKRLDGQVNEVQELLNQVERNRLELDKRSQQLEEKEKRLQKLQQELDKREKRVRDKPPEPANAKPSAAGNKSSQRQGLRWPGERLVADRPSR
jgi:exonuclease VII small subunit